MVAYGGFHGGKALVATFPAQACLVIVRDHTEATDGRKVLPAWLAPGNAESPVSGLPSVTVGHPGFVEGFRDSAVVGHEAKRG